MSPGAVKLQTSMEACRLHEVRTNKKEMEFQWALGLLLASSWLEGSQVAAGNPGFASFPSLCTHSLGQVGAWDPKEHKELLWTETLKSWFQAEGWLVAMGPPSSPVSCLHLCIFSPGFSAGQGLGLVTVYWPVCGVPQRYWRPPLCKGGHWREG